MLVVKEGLSKIEYLTLVAESTVMTGNSIEENFGFCILEALIFDTVPIIENKYSHTELLQHDGRCLFESSIDQFSLIESAMAFPFPVTHYADRYQNSMADIVRELVH